MAIIRHPAEDQSVDQPFLRLHRPWQILDQFSAGVGRPDRMANSRTAACESREDRAARSGTFSGRALLGLCQALCGPRHLSDVYFDQALYSAHPGMPIPVRDQQHRRYGTAGSRAAGRGGPWNQMPLCGVAVPAQPGRRTVSHVEPFHGTLSGQWLVAFRRYWNRDLTPYMIRALE